METRSAPGDELADRGIGVPGLEQFHQRFAGAQPRDPGAVGVIEGLFGQAEEVAIEWQNPVEAIDGNADVRDPGAEAAGVATCSGFVHDQTLLSQREERDADFRGR